MTPRIASAAVLVALLIPIAGCGTKKTTGSSLSGKVTLNGQPVKGGTLQFYSEAGAYTASIDGDGNYNLPDVPVGEMTVTVDNETLNPKNKPPVYTGGQTSGGASGFKGAAGSPMAGMYKKAMGGKSAAPSYKGPGVKVGDAPEGTEIVKEGTYVPIPAVYRKKETSTLKVKIEAGSNKKDLEMTGK